VSDGIIGWFARNRVAANLLMLVIMAAGLATAFTIKKEVFPEFSIDTVVVRVPFRGGSPQEVEEGVVIKIEEAIQAVNGIKRITSSASEGMGMVRAELSNGYDAQKVLNDIKVRVDGISTFPAEAERPIVEEIIARNQVMWVNLYGDIDEITLKRLADKTRDEITALPGVTQAEVLGIRNFEISVEVSEARLREYGLTFDQVARAIRASSIDLPAGNIRTEGGEVLLRTKGQAYVGDDFERLVLATRPDGSRITLGQVARVVDGFEDTPREARFNGAPSVGIQIFRVGDQSALHVAKTVRTYVDKVRGDLPDGVSIDIIFDGSRYLKERLLMLVRNGVGGLVLVFISLTLFLRPKLAFWVCLGIPLSFLGTLWVMPMPFMDVSINMITLFGFIVVLGIVVDDAIVIGENVYTTYKREGPGVESAIKGAKEVAMPATFGVLTTVVAFIPMLMVPGVNGKIWSGIALVVIACLLFSLVESKLILPAHLSTLKPREQDRSKLGRFARFQRAFGDGLERFVERYYRPLLAFAVRNRYSTMAVFVGIFIISIGLIANGVVRFVFFPEIESDVVEAHLTMADGTPTAYTKETTRRMEQALLAVNEELMAETGDRVVENIFGFVRRETSASIWVELTPSESRATPASEVARRWREQVGVIPGATEITFSGTMANSGRAIDLQLSSENPAQLEAAAHDLKQRLYEIEGVFDIGDNSSRGKQEIRLAIKPEAESLGLTLGDLARQVRQAFYGEQAQRIQRGRNDVRVMVRYPDSERRSLGNLEQMRIRTPSGAEVPFAAVAEVTRDRGYTIIRRADRRRVVNVQAGVDKDTISPDVIREQIRKEIVPAVLANYPDVRSAQEGEAREQAESMASLRNGGLLAAFLIYALMAIPLKSYTQPLIIMSVIPFGLIGAVGGHIILGLPISILSLCGMIALAGVVVNDSLVMVDFVNRAREKGIAIADAVRNAGAARFRAIMLTSLTTFAGLTPLLLEKSLQAQILIPMAASLAFGVLFATAITLVLIPCLYLILEDVKALSRRSKSQTEVEQAVAAAVGN
jgi:multidrug efflux pump subunit AcrB